MIIDEPIRGSVPPAWFWALPGLERIEALTAGHIELPPLFRLMGIRPAHVGPGSGTWIMPASECLAGLTTDIDATVLIDAALLGVATTVLRPGHYVETVFTHTDNFRPLRVQPGNVVARARVVNLSPFFVYTECQLEDPQGRQIATARSHAEIKAVEPSPPAAPAELRRVEVPVYPTPDPYQRSFQSASLSMEDYYEDGFVNILKGYEKGTYVVPYSTLLGHRFFDANKGKLTAELSASEWFSMFSRSVFTGVIYSVMNLQSFFTGWTLHDRNQSMYGFANSIRYFRSVPTDGRMLRMQSHGELVARDLLICRLTCHDADGNLVATYEGTGKAVDSEKRRKPKAATPRRVLCTLLFTDIVGSTEHAEDLGDTRWRALLDQHHAKVREELARHQGTEVDTAGDGFFARFDSPAQAIQCAQAIHAAVRSLGVELRIGIHTGECEVLGRNLSGMAVHIAARIQGVAQANEILVSSTVKDLVTGSDTTFTPRGEHTLKGVPGEWSLYAAT